MSEKDKTCTISGLRPLKLPEGMDRFKLFCRMDGEIRRSIFRGYTLFLSGMAMGADIWAGEIVLKIRTEFPQVRLSCYLPCETQADRWPSDWREKYFNILAEADDVFCLQAHYSDGCMQRRNRAMIEASSRLIAVYDGAALGGTAHAVHYARERGLDIAVIDPRECLG